MQIDYEYVKKILDVFLASESPTVNWSDFKEIVEDSENKFIFHIEILQDKSVINGVHNQNSLGIQRDTLNNIAVSIVPWRLTAEGHDFANSLSRQDIFSVIVKKSQNEGISFAMELAKKMASKKIETLIGTL